MDDLINKRRNSAAFKRNSSAALDLATPTFEGSNQNLGFAQGFKYMRRCIWNALALGLGDGAAIISSLLIVGAIRDAWMGESMIPGWSWVVVVAWWAVAVGQRLLPGWGIGPVEELRKVVILRAGLFAGELIVLVLTKHSASVSRLVLFGAFLLSLFLILGSRFVIKRILRRMGLWGVPTVVYADPETAASVIQSFRQNFAAGYIPIGVFCDESTSWGTSIEGLPVYGPTDLATSEAPVAILSTNGLSRERVRELLDNSLNSYRRVIIKPDLHDVQSLWIRFCDLGGMPGLEMSVNLLDPMARWTKYFIDYLLVLLTAPFWGAACALVTVVVWLEDRANPFYFQERIGKNGKPFRMRKFRTMVPNAEQALQKKLAEDPELAKEWEANFKLQHDPRITRIGNFLRKTSLDELPQLVNVLKREMSLVGPRPLPSYHQLELTLTVRSLRERVRPGLTGLWQVSGRSQAGTPGMEKWDAFYVRNWSIWLDLVIIARTLRVVIRGKGAY
jgi:Undecaprenyl-phosphate galactose phosphotransferase WbaP